MTGKTAIVLGASGAVGKQLVTAIATSKAFATIHTVTRGSVLENNHAASLAGCALQETILAKLDAASLERAVVSALTNVTDAVGFSTLGVGAGTSKMTIAEHRAIDVELNAAFARGLKASGKVGHLVFMSAAKADPNAKTTGNGAAGLSRYNRVKGESEEAVKAAGLAVVSIFRPAMIIGTPHTPALLGKILPLFAALTPKELRSIRIKDLAQAMMIRGRDGAETTSVHHYPEMMQLVHGSRPFNSP